MLTTKKEVLNKMATIGQEAQGYIPPQTKNIADLEEVSIDFELFDKEGSNSDGEKFKYKAIEVEGIEYRTPGKVLGDIKNLLVKLPNMKKFSVTRTGQGKQTSYTVIPCE